MPSSQSTTAILDAFALQVGRVQGVEQLLRQKAVRCALADQVGLTIERCGLGIGEGFDAEVFVVRGSARSASH
jgi:hypothetical protein